MEKNQDDVHTFSKNNISYFAALKAERSFIKKLLLFWHHRENKYKRFVFLLMIAVIAIMLSKQSIYIYNLNLVVVLSVLNFIFIYHNLKYQGLYQVHYDFPLEYFSVDKHFVNMGSTSFEVNKVTRIALNKDDQYAYCSLPYNYINGQVPVFSFSLTHYSDFEAYICEKLPKAKVID